MKGGLHFKLFWLLKNPPILGYTQSFQQCKNILHLKLLTLPLTLFNEIKLNALLSVTRIDLRSVMNIFKT